MFKTSYIVNLNKIVVLKEIQTTINRFVYSEFNYLCVPVSSENRPSY